MEPRPIQAPAIELADLAKTYPGAAGPALHRVDLTIPAGSIFGLLGPNGAGKSTLINILAGLVRRSGGTARILGMEVETRAARHAIGVVPQELNLDPYFTPRAALDLQAGLFGIPRRSRRTEPLLAALGLAAMADRPARSLSGGMRRRLMVAKALVHDPPVLVLDEPTAGVDVELRRQLWDHVRRLNRAGTTVLLSTHYLHEAEMLCDRIAVLSEGALLAVDTTEALLRGLKDRTLDIELERPLAAVPPGLAGFDAVLATPRRIVIRYGQEPGAAARILAALHAAALPIRDLGTERPGLEDAFLELVRRRGARPAGQAERASQRSSASGPGPRAIR